MESPVLTYHHEDFEVVVRTDEIAGAWERFQGRINYRNDWTAETSQTRSYCKYSASEGCAIHLYNYDTDALEPISAEQAYWPVIYETNKYHISIKFHNLDEGTKPVARHIKREVEDFFFYDFGRLSGDVNFLNEPGLFRLGLEYQKHGQIRKAWFAFEVVSPKLDVKEDYKSILRAVNAEFEGLIFRYFSLTMQQLSQGHHRPLEVWMQVFEGVVADYLKNIDRIIKNPHSKSRTETLYAKADRIKRWTPQMEETYAEKEVAGKLDEHYFRYEVYDRTVNSLENRFVKYTLQQIGKQLSAVFSNVLSRNLTEISTSYREQWEDYQHRIDKALRHPFFQGVGKFEGLRQESLVLQSRMGYQQVYKDWLKLKKGIDFYQGATNIGTLQIWEIYELWCFIKVKQMVLRILNVEPHDDRVSEPNGSLINYQRTLSANKRADYRVEIKNGDEIISIHYQHTFSRLHEDDFDIRTMTTEQRPDIIINIRKANGEVLTYLYDAKYRVWSDKNLDHPDDWFEQDPEMQQDLRGADYPPADAINQMHRYRDAIYYGMGENERPRSKEVIGGYILFPGRGDDATIANRFYSKSIEQVNIGAFPLLPCGKQTDEDTDLEGPQLYAHLKKILLEKNVYYEHVEDCIPQRGLQYDLRPKEGDSLVLVGYAKAKDMELFKEKGLYYTRAGLEAGSLRLQPGFEWTRYLLLHDAKCAERTLYILNEKGPRIVGKQALEAMGFSPSHDLYLVFDFLESAAPITIDPDAKLPNVKKKYDPYFISFNELMSK